MTKGIIQYYPSSYVFYDMHLNCTRCTPGLNKLKAMREQFTPRHPLRSRQSTGLCYHQLPIPWCAVGKKAFIKNKHCIKEQSYEI